MINNIVPDLDAYRVSLDSLKLDPKNSRVHPAENLEDIKASLTAFGQDQLIVFRQDTHEIIKGNGRWQAMKDLGWTEAAAIGVDDDATKATARSIADNHSSDSSNFDENALALQLKDLLGTEWEKYTGFDQDEVDDLLKDYVERTEADAKAREAVDETRSAELALKWGTTTNQLWGFNRGVKCPKCGKFHLTS